MTDKLILSAQEFQNRNRLKETKPRVYEKFQNSAAKILSGQPVPIIQFQYNYQCNFKCEHCSIAPFQSTPKQKLESGRPGWDMAKVRELSRQADELGLARFVITGGEPLTYPDFDQLVEAIDPNKHYINCDTNGWFLDEKKAYHLKAMGVDRVQMSLDSLNAEEHDAFRNKKGSHARCLRAIDACQKVGLEIYVQTVVTKTRCRSQEFKDFVKFLNAKGVGVFISYAKQVGEWQGEGDILVNKDDMRYIDKMEKENRLFTHISPSYGFNMRCIAVKGMISVTDYGDVLPCPYIHTSIGNVFKEPLKDIIQRGLDIKYFGEWKETCLIAEDRHFIEKYVAGKIDGKKLPVPCEEVFSAEDKTQYPYHKNPRLVAKEDLFVGPDSEEDKD